MITSGNQVIRLEVNEIRKTGRDAKGVRLQRLGEGEEVIAVTNLGKQAKQITEITGHRNKPSSSAPDSSISSSPAVSFASSKLRPAAPRTE